MRHSLTSHSACEPDPADWQIPQSCPTSSSPSRSILQLMKIQQRPAAAAGLERRAVPLPWAVHNQHIAAVAAEDDVDFRFGSHAE